MTPLMKPKTLLPTNVLRLLHAASISSMFTVWIVLVIKQVHSMQPWIRLKESSLQFSMLILSRAKTFYCAPYLISTQIRSVWFKRVGATSTKTILYLLNYKLSVSMGTLPLNKAGAMQVDTTSTSMVQQEYGAVQR